ncbi:MAG: hypothetical protein V2J62_03900 [candidate division KSB1 bacterium]|jgi:hypothetical protein|nr:hypothetical protein [candidate division KSB1 bacterium]
MSNHKRFAHIFILLSIVILFSTADNLHAGEMDAQESQSAKISMPEWPYNGGKFATLEDEVSFRVYKALRRVGMFDVAVGIAEENINLESLDSTAIDLLLSEFEPLRGFAEALVLTLNDFSQNDVPPEDSSYFSFSGKHQPFRKSTDKVGDRYPNNIKTDVSVSIQIADIEMAEFLGSFEVDVTNVGGDRAKSKTRAMKKLENKLVYELKWFYWLSYDIYEVSDDMLFSSFETQYPVRKGMIFEIVEPDRIWTIDGKKSLTRGGRAGFAAVHDTADGGTQLKILRQWRPVYPETWTVEYPARIHGLGAYLITPSVRKYSGLGIQYFALPLKKLDWGGGIKFLKITDSYEEDNFGFGFNLFGLWRFSRGSRMDFGIKGGLDLDIAFKKDDEDMIVNAGLFSGSLGFYSEFLLSAKTDFVCEIGYRLGVKTDTWDYSDEDEDGEPYWLDEAPELNNTGFVLSLGIKYHLF